MVTGIISTSLLLLLEMMSSLKRNILPGIVFVALMFVYLFHFENIKIHFSSGSLNDFKLWPVLIVYFHLFLFEYLTNKKRLSLSILVMPAVFYMNDNPMLQISILLSLAFFDRKNYLDFSKFYVHILGLVLAIYSAHNQDEILVGQILFGLYLAYSIFQLYNSKNTNGYCSEKLIYLVLNLLVIKSVLGFMDPTILKYVFYFAFIFSTCVAFLLRVNQAKIVSFFALYIIIFMLIFGIVELHQVLLLTAIMSEQLLRSSDLIFLKGKNFSFKKLSNTKIILYLFSFFYLLKSLGENYEYLIVSSLIFALFAYFTISSEKKGNYISKSDGMLLFVLIIDLGGVIWLC